jgi:hypothetical protein
VNNAAVAIALRIAARQASFKKKKKRWAFAR